VKTERVLITGGAGFIGVNLANRLLSEGHDVTIFDNLSRSGCESNLTWLRNKHGASAFQLITASVTDFDAVKKAVADKDRIYHLAGQVAVTTSVKNPRKDFEDNALGTFNALEAVRISGDDPVFIYASTNKVYGGMEDVAVVEESQRYRYLDFPNGIPESQTVDFHSPYGCSKGAADQYVRDYARIYNLRTVVSRQSCIYGYRQFGVEDQGWVAWFIIAALKNKSITIYGNGKQVRDILFIDDLLDAYESMVKNIDTTVGEIYNIGGGPSNVMSIWAEFGPMLEKLIGHQISVTYQDWRPGDQPVYVSDIQKAKNNLGWSPKISVAQGIKQLFEWARDNQEYFGHI
jgi:CDP-paratose 2-epimerase